MTPPLHQDVISKIKKLREEGYSQPKISALLGVSEGTVRNHCDYGRYTDKPAPQYNDKKTIMPAWPLTGWERRASEIRDDKAKHQTR